MADQLAVRLIGGPFNGWWITDAEHSFQYNKSLSYTFAIEINFEATFPGYRNIPGFHQKPSLSMWAIYGRHPIALGPNETPVVAFNEVTWMPPTGAVVVMAIRDRPPWEVDAFDELMKE